MSLELIVFSTILVLSVVAHYFFWKDSKKRYSEYMKRVEALNERIRHLEANDSEIDKMLDETEEDVKKMGNEIDEMRLLLSLKKKKTTFDN